MKDEVDKFANTVTIEISKQVEAQVKAFIASSHGVDFVESLEAALKRVANLEARCAWQAEMLERAKRIIGDTAEDWLADLEKGPNTK